MTSRTDPDRGRRVSDRGRYGGLSRERVLAAALDVVDREGLSSLSMRRLGAELEVEAMALYRYAAGKEALLDGLVEALYLELEENLDTSASAADKEVAEPVPWRDELHRIAQEYRRVSLAHPQVVPLLATRMLAMPMARRPLAVLRFHERLLALFDRAGLDDHTAALVLQVVTAWLLGCSLVELRAMVDNPEEPEPAFRLGLHLMPAQELPRLRAIAPALAERGGPEPLAAGLDALLDQFTAGM